MFLDTTSRTGQPASGSQRGQFRGASKISRHRQSTKHRRTERSSLKTLSLWGGERLVGVTLGFSLERLSFKFSIFEKPIRLMIVVRFGPAAPIASCFRQCSLLNGYVHRIRIWQFRIGSKCQVPAGNLIRDGNDFVADSNIGDLSFWKCTCVNTKKRWRKTESFAQFYGTARASYLGYCCLLGKIVARYAVCKRRNATSAV